MAEVVFSDREIDSALETDPVVANCTRCAAPGPGRRPGGLQSVAAPIRGVPDGFGDRKHFQNHVS